MSKANNSLRRNKLFYHRWVDSVSVCISFSLSVRSDFSRRNTQDSWYWLCQTTDAHFTRISCYIDLPETWFILELTSINIPITEVGKQTAVEIRFMNVCDIYNNYYYSTLTSNQVILLMSIMYMLEILETLNSIVRTLHNVTDVVFLNTVWKHPWIRTPWLFILSYIDAIYLSVVCPHIDFWLKRILFFLYIL